MSISFVAITVLHVALGATTAWGCANSDAVPGVAPADVLQTATVCLMNERRAAAGIAPLASERKLGTSAAKYSAEMVGKGFFDHVSPSGSTVQRRLKDVRYWRGYRSWEIGENIAWATGARSTPGEIVAAWMESPDHRANIMERAFREVGVGVVGGVPVPYSGATAATYTAEFGVRY